MELWAIAGEEDEEDIAGFQVAAMCMGLVKVSFFKYIYIHAHTHTHMLKAHVGGP